MKTILTKDNRAVGQLVKQLWKPEADSHKGQNGKVLVIGGSELFHSSLIWAATMASKLVDMVHVASPAEMNERLVRERIKEQFLDGIVVPWNRVEEYIAEDDVILIGPGMVRNEGLEPGETPTATIVNALVARYSHKKWVIDGGALQEIDPQLLSKQMIITPHAREYERLCDNATMRQSSFAKGYGGTRCDDVTILLKGRVDKVMRDREVVEIVGGNAGMTKGGTGDVLAGLTAAFYAKNDAFLSAYAASAVCKRAGDELAEKVGFAFCATDLLAQIPHTLHSLLG